MAETEIKKINGRTLCDATAREAAKRAQETADAITVPKKISEIENDSGFIAGDDIVDNLDSDASDRPLAAKQGNILKQDLENLETILRAIQDKLNSGSSGVDTITVNEINDMIVEYFENKTVSEVEA